MKPSSPHGVMSPPEEIFASSMPKRTFEVMNKNGGATVLLSPVLTVLVPFLRFFGLRSYTFDQLMHNLYKFKCSFQ